MTAAEKEARLLARARDPATSPTWLGGLAMHSLALAKAVAENPSTTPRILRCIALRWKEARLEVARHPALERTLANKLARTFAPALLANPSLPARIAGRRSLSCAALGELAARGPTPEWFLPALVGHAHPRVREVAAKAPWATAEILVALSRDPSVRVRAAAARHEALPLGEAARLTGDVEAVRLGLARRSQLDAALAARLGRDGAVRVRMAVAEQTRQRDLLVELAGDGHPAVRRQVGRNPGAPEAVLLALAGDPEPGVRLAVAQNSETPAAALARLLERPGAPDWLSAADITRAALAHWRAAQAQPAVAAALGELAASSNPAVRRCAAEGPLASLELLARLASDVDAEVRLAVARHGALHPSSTAWLGASARMLAARLAVQLARDPAIAVRKAIALYGVEPEALLRLTGDASRWVRLALARSARAPAEALAQLAGDADAEVRQEVARNAVTPVETLVALLEGEDGVAKMLAVMNPALPLSEVLAVARRARGFDHELRRGLHFRFDRLSPDDPAFAAAAAMRNLTIDAGLARSVQLPPAIAEALARSAHAEIREALAQYTPDPQRLAQLARDPVRHVRSRVASRLEDFAMPEVARLLAGDDEESVRSAVALSTKDPVVLAALAADGDAQVARAALSNPATPLALLLRAFEHGEEQASLSARGALGVMKHPRVGRVLCWPERPRKRRNQGR